MDIEREAVVNAPQEKLWELIEQPDQAFRRARPDMEAEDLGDGRYKLKFPVKMGLFKLKLECNAHFTNKRPMEHSDVEFKLKLPGGKVEGSGTVDLERVDAERTRIAIKLAGSSGGVLSKMLGGSGGDRLGRIADGFIKGMEAQAGGKG